MFYFGYFVKKVDSPELMSVLNEHSGGGGGGFNDDSF